MTRKSKSLVLGATQDERTQGSASLSPSPRTASLAVRRGGSSQQARREVLKTSGEMGSSGRTLERAAAQTNGNNELMPKSNNLSAAVCFRHRKAFAGKICPACAANVGTRTCFSCHGLIEDPKTAPVCARCDQRANDGLIAMMDEFPEIRDGRMKRWRQRAV